MCSVHTEAVPKTAISNPNPDPNPNLNSNQVGDNKYCNDRYSSCNVDTSGRPCKNGGYTDITSFYEDGVCYKDDPSDTTTRCPPPPASHAAPDHVPILPHLPLPHHTSSPCPLSPTPPCLPQPDRTLHTLARFSYNNSCNSQASWDLCKDIHKDVVTVRPSRACTIIIHLPHLPAPPPPLSAHASTPPRSTHISSTPPTSPAQWVVVILFGVAAFFLFIAGKK